MADYAEPGPPWRLYLGILAAWFAIGCYVTLADGVSSRTARGFIDLGYVLLPLVGAVAAAHRAREHRDVRRTGWILFAFAFLSWSVGGAIWGYEEIVQGNTPRFPSFADIGFVGFPLLSAAGLAILTRQWSPRLSAPEFLDVLFIGFASAFAIYAAVLDEAFAGGEAEGLALVASFAYPAADIAVLTIAVFALSRAPETKRTQPLFIGGGLALLVIVDVIWIYRTAEGVYESGGPFDLLWHVAFAIIVAGVLYRHEEPDWAPPPQIARAALWTPAVLTAPIVATVVFEHWVHDGLDSLAILFVLALFVLLVIRQTLALHHNDALRSTIQTTNERLVEAAVFKTQFINATAHELGNPLTPVRIHASLLADPTYASVAENRASTAAVLARSTDRMVRLVEDLLELARIQSGKFSVRPEPTDLGRIALETAHLYEAAALQRKVRLAVQAEPGLVAETDPQRVAQILTNLVSNAIKYSPEGEIVHMRLFADGDRIKVEVEDRGPGLTKDQREKLFRPFAQVHTADQQLKGTGLGLYICAMIAQRLGAEVGVESPGPGAGSTFWFRIPRKPAP